MMKNIIIAILILQNVTVFAQEEKVKGIVKINPLSLLVATINMAYEVPTSEKSSLQFAAFYTSMGGNGNNKIRGFGFIPEYRFYLSKTKDAPRGFYVAPTLRFSKFKYTIKNYNTYINNTYYPTYESDLTQMGVSGNIGGQWIWKSGFCLDVYGGPALLNLSMKSNTGQLENAKGIGGGFGLVFGTRIAYAF